MIQRVQTLWLALAVLLSIAMFFFPLAIFSFHYKEFTIDGVYRLIPSQGSLTQTNIAWSSLITNVLVGIISLITIFLYSNRGLQRKVLAFAFLIALIEIALNYFWQMDAGLKEAVTAICKGTPEIIQSTIDNAKATWGFGMFFPVAQLVFFVFALRGIRKDEAIVRSADRIR